MNLLEKLSAAAQNPPAKSDFDKLKAEALAEIQESNDKGKHNYATALKNLLDQVKIKPEIPIFTKT